MLPGRMGPASGLGIAKITHHQSLAGLIEYAALLGINTGHTSFDLFVEAMIGVIRIAWVGQAMQERNRQEGTH